MPFVYSKNNKDIEELNKGPINVSDAPCNKKVCKVTGCMPWTFLEISWSKTVDDVLDVYAYTHLVGDVEQGKKLSDRLVDDEMTFEMEIEGGSGFTMDFGGKESFNASKNAVCVRKNNSIVEPETWTITNADLKGERLLVYSLLPLSASFVFDGNKLTSKKPPVGPHCDLFVQFNRTDYDLLFVPLPPPSTPAPTTTTKIPSTRAETSLQTTTISPCPTASTTPMAAVKTTKCPSTETKSGSPVLLILFILVLFGCVITNGIWFYLYKKGKDDKEKQEEEKKAKSIVKSTKGSLYEPDVNTAIQMDVGNAKTASEAVKSTTAGVEADVGSKAGEDNNALNAVATKTLNEV
uniref:DOMON domain-containing protein n=1 Tax=Meloidogyne hapla TaxID=6305 RepID=A0A1I8AZI0_MELHA